MPALLPSPLQAAEAIIAPGDAAVTGFSGIVPADTPPKGMHPLDVTVIDPDKPSLQVLDLSKLGGRPKGQLADAPAKLKIKAADIGQVFGVALDSAKDGQPPNIYAAATSLYGLQIVEDGKDGNTLRLVKGSPGARWMPGQFGLEKGGGPGSVWKIDGRTGDVTLFSTLTSGNLENAGAGLGGLTFDPATGQLYAVSLETGLIHRLDATGRELDTFDHGLDGRPKANLDEVADDPKGRMDITSPDFSIEDPSTWGYADKRRLAVAVAIEGGRLYYSVAEGPSIWSVDLNSDGSFGRDVRREIDVTGTPNNNWITSIAFDGPETLYMSQRGEQAGAYDYGTFARPAASTVWRYTWDASAKEWKAAPDETAIGLEPPHRSTNGGLALGYGYDGQGNIDRGRCRETLWTTGEQLRNGPDTEGERIIQGLQGNAKSLAKAATIVRPRSGATALQGDFGDIIESNLEAPKETWFIDADGAYDDEAAHGHMGAVAIFTPCEGAKAASPAERPRPPLYPVPPIHKTPGIRIDKACLPGAFGGPITCRITVRNTGIETLAPVSFSDATAVLFGPGIGAQVAIQSFLPDGPGWICTPTPTPAFQCVLAGGLLLPGVTRFVDVVIDTGPLFLAGNTGFRNCATLDAPWHGFACAEGGTGAQGGLVMSKTGPAQCNPGTNCTFALSIANTSGFPFGGNVQISDSMFVGGAPVAAPIVASTLNCNGGNPAALPFTCVVPVNLPPGGAQVYSVTVTMPAAPPNFWAQNCFAAFDPAFVPPGGPFPAPGGIGGVGAGSPQNPVCHWVAAGNPPPQSNLRLTKSPAGVACDSSLGTGIASCNYEIRVSNDGPSPFNNILSINEVAPAGSNLLLNPNWPCVAAGPGFTCTSPAPVAIPSGGAFVMQATIQIPALLTEPTCQVPNTASIASPLGAPLNVVAGDDASGASQSTQLIAVLNPDGTVSVACDPTNLKTTKAVVSCTDGGDSLQCTHRITVSNTGPDPYKGPINITDSYSITPSNVSFPAGWNCAPAGTGFLCNKPGVELSPPGQSGPNAISIEVTAKVPKAGQCRLRNTATMSFPPSGTRFNGRGDDDTSSVSMPILSPECSKAPVCESPGDGEFQTASGACACKDGFTRDKKGRCVETGTPPPPATCPDGKPIPRNGVCPCERGTKWNSDTLQCEALCEPGRNEYRTSAGQCVCKSGYVRRDGRCVTGEDDTPPPPAPPPVIDRCDPGPHGYRTRSGQCLCDEGYERAGGRCVKIEEPEQCVPGPNEYRTKRGLCLCEDGYDRVDGRCVRETPQCDPGPHGYRTRKGLCLCDDGYIRIGGRCVPEMPPPSCGPYEVVSRSGQCICREGFVRIEGRCIERPRECPEGFEGRYPNCYRPEVKECPEGYEGRYADCRPVRLCPPGTEGRYPECRKVESERCPEGSIGKYPDCRKPDVKMCPEGYEGKYPDCRKAQRNECPEGWDGKYPNCRKPEMKQCPEGTEGRYPNCKRIDVKRCPEGTTGQYPNCKSKEKDTSNDKDRDDNGRDTSKPKDQDKPKCPSGTMGTYPNCKKIESDPPRKEKPPKDEPKTNTPSKPDKPPKVDKPPKIEKAPKTEKAPKAEKTQKADPKPQKKSEPPKLEKKGGNKAGTTFSNPGVGNKGGGKKGGQGGGGPCPKGKKFAGGKCV